MRKRVAVALVLAIVLAGAGCGAHDDSSSPRGAVRAGTLGALWKRPGEDVALVMGTSDYAPGPVRVSFLVLTHAARPIERSTARVWLARSLSDAPFLKGTARLERVAPGIAVYVASLRVPHSGRYFLLAEPTGGYKIQGVATLDVPEKSQSPAIGASAFPSKTPTLEDAPAEKITTARPPDVELLRTSVQEALERHRAFVVVFATPKFCASRTCGPAVEIADSVRKRFGGSGIDFIHVEIYDENNPALGQNRWVQEWRLPTEPWVFLVGRDGRIKAKFEGAFSADELARAVQRFLV